MPVLVLDEQLERGQLADALRDRGMGVATVGDFGATGRPDPDVVRQIVGAVNEHWILVTMDLTIVEDYPGFDWSRYAIAWIRPHEKLRGVAVERAKAEIIHRYAHAIRELAGGDHHTFTAERHFKSRPSLAYMTRKRV
jgi:hypothetical protein